jgi:phosphate regulon transcriptional regulator PhoB
MDKDKILVIDDEPDIRELVSYNLKKEGYRVSTAATGEQALEQARKGAFSLFILDLMLPGILGIELCRMLRSDPRTESVPIIMLTARGEESDKVVGLESGADDYVTKPFSPKELIARVRAILRRTGGKKNLAGTVTLGDLEIDRDQYSVRRGKKTIDLSATEFKLLLFLAERRGRVFSRDQLLDAVWKDESFVEPRTVDVHISRLRTQIEDDPSDPVHIKTKRGVGYYVE